MEQREISFVRGDTKLISRIFKDKDDNILIFNKETDKMNFTVRRYINSEVSIHKNLDSIIVDEEGKYTIIINPEDTENLSFGTYGYDIELTIGDYVRTVESGTFTLLEYDYSRAEVNE